MALISFSSASYADEISTNKICQLSSPNAVKKIEFNHAPSWFAKAVPGHEAAGIILSSGPYILNFSDGTFHSLPGKWDPVPTPDGLFMTSLGNSMYWTVTSEALKSSDGDTLPRWTAGEYNNNWKYQSIGLLKNQTTETHKSYRVLVDNDNGALYIRDTTFDLSRADDVSDAKMKEGKWVKVCPNISATLKLPVISKDGKMISVQNTSSNRTEIYDLADNGGCTLKEQLPFAASKTDFSFDGKQIAFHRTNEGNASSWFEHAAMSDRIQVYTYDLTKHQLKRLSDHIDGNSYFPTFLPNGNIGFLDESGTPGAVRYAYEIVDPNGARSASFSEDKAICVKQYAAALAIGETWAQLCPELVKNLSLDTLALTPLTLPAANCQLVADQALQQYKTSLPQKVAASSSYSMFSRSAVAQAMGELSPIDIKAACGSPATAPLSATLQTLVAKKGRDGISTPRTVFKTTCSECHAGAQATSGHSFNFSSPRANSLATRKLMAEKIRNNSMPPGGGLDDVDKAKLIKYLLAQ